MTPAEAYASHHRFLTEGGEPQFWIRRYAGAPRVATDTPALAKAVAYSPGALVGSAMLGDIKFVVLVDELVAALGEITIADKLLRGSKEMTIKKVDPVARRFAGVVIALEIWVNG